jgi:enoyl-CoA hydratase
VPAARKPILAMLLPEIDRLFASDQASRKSLPRCAQTAPNGRWRNVKTLDGHEIAPDDEARRCANSPRPAGSRLSPTDMALEYGLAVHVVIDQPDIVEGVRALIVEKDNRRRNGNPAPVELMSAMR